jgi:hypothetical protein
VLSVAAFVMGTVISATQALAQPVQAFVDQVARGEGQAFLISHGGLCFAVTPKHVLEIANGILGGSARLTPEGAGGQTIGAIRWGETPFDAVVLETEGTPPSGCGPPIRSWRPPVREALAGAMTASLRFISPDGGIRALPLVIRATTFTEIRFEAIDNALIQQGLSGSLVMVGETAVGMLVRAPGESLGAALRLDQVLASVREMLAPEELSPSVSMSVSDVSLSSAVSGAAVLQSTAAPVDVDSRANLLLAPSDTEGLFRATAPKGARLVIDLAGDEPRPVACVRFDFAGVPADERPRGASLGISTAGNGAFIPIGTIAMSSIADATDRAFGLPQRAKRVAVDLQPSRHPNGILSIRRLIVLEAQGQSGGCP